MKRILVLDNYDSFTYNLVHLVRELGYDQHMDVFRNDKIDLDGAKEFDHILLSPGPGLPKDAGIMPRLIEQLGPARNVLGVCLGHQGIAEVFGASLFNLPKVFHGVATEISLTEDRDDIFNGLPKEFTVCRYHSWVVKSGTLPPEFAVTALAEESQIMGIKHKKYQIRGVQFHPESIMTQHGREMINNWLNLKAS